MNDMDDRNQLDPGVIALLRSYLAEDAGPHTAEEIAEAEADLLEFKRNMNRWRSEGGERLLFPHMEE